ncbi:hypothetical protein G9A89_006323 [Geosiphon pyriformis]|nr:hypothetical protein G9A89_006323 [Geosiphon pyriformis]
MPNKRKPKSHVNRIRENFLNEYTLSRRSQKFVDVKEVQTPTVGYKSFNCPENIPLEILTNICTYLTPSDLKGLRLVCKFFNEVLGSPVYSISQQIWENSRLAYCPDQQMPPPEDMSEQAYENIVLYENGCQLCGNKDETPSIFWVVKIRCCTKCLQNNILSKEQLQIKWQVPDELIEVIEPVTQRDLYEDGLSYYWKSQVALKINQYIRLFPTKKETWLQHEKTRIHKIKQETFRREQFDDHQIQHKINSLKSHLESLVTEFFKSITSPQPRGLRKQAVQSCPCYKKLLSDIESLPFIPKEWGSFKVKLELEIKENLKKHYNFNGYTSSNDSTIADDEDHQSLDDRCANVLHLGVIT